MPNRLLWTYDPFALAFAGGEGAWLWDEHGNRFLDAISGIGVNLLGHNHPEWVECFKQQSSRLIHVSNMYHIPEKEMLAEQLCLRTGMEKAYFANSGSEAVEAAIKLARLYGHSRLIEHPTILVFENAFHGRTLATLTASGHRLLQAGFEPLASGFVRAPFGDINALQHIANTRHDVVAVLVEPIQGAGGIHVGSAEFLQEIRTLCDQNEWLMMADEIQTGLGRTGQFLCSEHAKVQPDIVTMAKGLANGIAMGACLTRGNANNLFTPEKHGSTLGGNPFACAMALKTLELIDKHSLINNASVQGQDLIASLTDKFRGHPLVHNIRGKGLMIGIELNKPCKSIAKIALKHGLLVNVPQPNVVRMLPPLIISKNEVDLICEKFGKILEEFESL